MSDKYNKKAAKPSKASKKVKKVTSKSNSKVMENLQTSKSLTMNARTTNTAGNATSPVIKPPAEPKKLERSNSFFLTRKLSEIVSSITRSKEHLPTKPSGNDENSNVMPYKFTRSRSMILLRRPNRRSVIEPQLEKLCEEMERSDRSSQATSPPPPISPISPNTPTSPTSPLSKIFPAQDPFQRKRSSTLITTLKRTFSNSSEKKKEANPRWSASLLSLQEIDNMVSYENLSFIDYDKFNNYEQFLQQSLSQQDISHTTPPPETVIPQKVVRRKKPSRAVNHQETTLSQQNLKFDPNYEFNLDKKKNLYRQSLDDRKLRHINDVQRDSFRWSNSFEPLVRSESMPQDSSVQKCEATNLKSASLGSAVNLIVEASNRVVDYQEASRLKSKSLTHLDTLDSMVACHQEPTELAQKNRVSSSEYFSVYFCTDGTVQEEELIPATKGTTLGEALCDALKKRKLNFGQITVSDYTFADLGSPPYYTSCYDENMDVESLAGMQLIVMEKDTIKKPGTLQKAASFGSRTRPPRLLSSASTEETSESEQKAIPGKQLKQRWSGLFGLKNPQQSQLCELLNFYAKKGVPQKQSALNFDHPDFDMALEYLDNIHKSWQEFVHCEGMSENDVKIQTAIWELVTTEVDYIHALQTVTDLFLACLEAVQDEKLLTDVDQKKLFSNIRDICAANLKFWTLYIYPMVAHSITTHSPLCIDYFQQGFVTFATTFAPYKKYCAEQSTCQFYCKELNRNNALFTAYLAWCESQKMCNRLRLADILVRPMQRLTKYSLLLTAIRKHILEENDGDIMDCMIHSVENFVCSVNTHLTTRQENERLKGIMARIESYDVVDSNNEHLDKLAKQYSAMLDLCSPMKGCVNNQGRHLFMEGDLKLKDNQGKLDVHCFLLTDILLISKTVAKKSQGTLKVIRQPYLTDRLVVKHKDNTLYCVYLNEFQMVVAAFTLQCAEAKSWHDSITKAKHIYSRLKQGSSWDGYNLRYAGSSSTVGADTLGIKKSPLNSSVGSRVSSLNNSHSGSVELNDSRNISVDFEKANSLSSDEGSMLSANNMGALKAKPVTSPHKKTSSSNTLVVQPLSGLGQSLPNLSLHQNQVSNNTLLVPGTASSHSGNLLSPSHRGISYPPPSPTRATLRRGFAFSSSIKNPPLVKTRNITSQSSINWHQTPATPSTSPQQQSSPSSQSAQQQSTQQATSATSSLATNLQISNESDV